MKIASVSALAEEKLKAHPESPLPGTLNKEDIDDYCLLASEIGHTPLSLVCIIDTNLQCFGSDNAAICSYMPGLAAFCSPEALVVPDLAENARYSNNPLLTQVPGLSSYAGFPIVNSNGDLLATLCTWDTKTGGLRETQIQALQALARQIAKQFEEQKVIAALSHKIEELKLAYADLENFSTIAAHDLKSPLNAMISLTHLLQRNYATTLDDEGNEYINFLSGAVNNLAELVTGILNYSRSSELLTTQAADINFTDLVEEVTGLIEIPGNASIDYEKSEALVKTSPIALKQVLMNLLDNAIRHNDKSKINIEITLQEDPGSYTIKVTDNGPGIPGPEQERVFDLFKKMPSKVKNSKGLSTGLPIVKKLIDKLGGTVAVASEMGTGTTFIVTLPK